MRVLLWNVNRGPGVGRLEWLEVQPWDVAILLEVGKDGWRRLAAGPWSGVSTIDLIDRPGNRYSVALLSRRGSIDLIEGPVLPGRYDERALAAQVQVGGQSWTVVGVHMPNSVRGRGPRDHTPKEACFNALGNWLSKRDRPRLVLGIDANRSDWSGDGGSVSTSAPIAQAFMRAGGAPWLYDTHLKCRPESAKRPVTYRKRGTEQYFDRILVSNDVGATTCEILEPRTPGGRRLSDHFALVSQLTS